MDLVIFGDFNCPYSALASERAARLERAGVAHVDWRAVEHDPTIPPAGEVVEGTVRADLDEELEKVHGLLVAGDEFAPHRPPVRSNTAAAVEQYAGVEPDRRARVRVELFRRYWLLGEDLGDERVVDTLGGQRDPVTAAAWNREWSDLGQPVVPTMRLPDGYVSRGLGALKRLADLLEPGDGQPIP